MAPSAHQGSKHFASPCHHSPPGHGPLRCYRGLEHKLECVTTLLKTLKRIISELLTRPTSTLLAKLWPQSPTISTSTQALSPHRASNQAPSTSLRLTHSQISGLKSDPLLALITASNCMVCLSHPKVVSFTRAGNTVSHH